MLNNIAIQLKALEKECLADFEGTLRELKNLGFNGIEFCGFYGKTADEVKEIVNKLDLTIVSSHININDILDNYDEILDYHKRLGCKRIVITYGDIHGLESLSMLINDLNSLHIRLQKQGIELLYHNHEREFKKYATGEIALTSIMNNTKLNLELDSFWAEQGGADIMQVLEQYKSRIPLIHIKDGINHLPTAIGEGTATIKPVYDYCIENKLEWIIIEVSSSMKEPMAAIRKSVDYINNNF